MNIKPEKVCESIRNSFNESSIVYSYGGCYNFYKILKTIFPKVVCYQNEGGGHVYSKIDGKFYDIDGQYIPWDGQPMLKVTKNQHINWDRNMGVVTLERIMQKHRHYIYNDYPIKEPLILEQGYKNN